MEWSSQNYVFEHENNYYLYNYNSGVLLKLSSSNYFKLLKIKETPKLLDKFKYKEYFIKHSVFVDSNNTIFSRHREEIVNNRASNEIFDVFIYPTLGCNLQCPYCFQLPYDKNTMDNETINKTSKFVSDLVNKNNSRFLRVVWIGGEPLLCLDKIEKIYHFFSSEIKNFDEITYVSSMITNGVFFTEKNIERLNRLKIYKLQITIDGLEENHNKRRPSHNNKDSFQTILNNMETLLNYNNIFRVSIRVNISNENKNEFVEIHKYLSNRFNENLHRIFIYPGYIDEYSLTCKSSNDSDSCNMSRKERADFVLDLYNKYSIKTQDFLPLKNSHSCMARTINSYSVGPKGYIYKCTTAVGKKEYSIGNVNGEYFSNVNVLNEFLYEKDYLADKNCSSCNHFFCL